MVTELHRQNITLLAFTFNYVGTMGPSAHNNVFDTPRPFHITDSSKLANFNPPGLMAYKKGKAIWYHYALLPRANKGWESKHSDG